MPANTGYIGSVLFALFLVGWGLSFVWGPIGDRFGRTRTLAATVLIYSVFTGAAALSQNVYELALFRFLAGIGIGGEWAMAGTYVAEAWPEDRRKMGAGYLQSGYYFGFFAAAALNATIGATYGWRAMFLCGLFPVVVSLVTLFKVKEPERWERDPGYGRAERQPAAPDLRAALPHPHPRHVDAADRRHHRPLGRLGLRARRRHHAGQGRRLRASRRGPLRLLRHRASCRSARCWAAWRFRRSPSGSAGVPRWRCSSPACWSSSR